MHIQDIILGLSALTLVLGLIWLARQGARAAGMKAVTGGGRLRVVHSLALDTRRRCVLLQCDGQDILLLIGGPNDLLLAHPSSPATTDRSAP